MNCHDIAQELDKKYDLLYLLYTRFLNFIMEIKLKTKYYLKLSLTVTQQKRKILLNL
jgi:hypothetical protein